MDYIDAATTGTLSPHTLPIVELKKMLSHIEETVPSTHIFQSHPRTLYTSTTIFIHMF